MLEFIYQFASKIYDIDFKWCSFEKLLWLMPLMSNISWIKSGSWFKKGVIEIKKGITQPAIACSKLTMEILEQGVKYVQCSQ